MSLQISLPGQPPSLSKNDRYEQTISCLKQLNCQHDLRSFARLVLTIEALDNTRLLKWKSSFTSKLFSDLKASMKKHKQLDQNKYLHLMTVSNFSAFVHLNDLWTMLAQEEGVSEKTRTFLFEFFEIVSGVVFMIEAPANEVLNELQSVQSEKSWNSKVEWARSGLELIRSGVQLESLMSYVRDSFRIDPVDSVRRMAAEPLPALASPTVVEAD